MNPLPLQRTCAVCNRVFATFKPHALYCSAACKRIVLLRKRHEAGRRRRHRRCPRCGRAFVGSRSDAQFCSNACRQAMHRRRHRAERLS
jgi:endogenous inhibitor of DNA gyrase (YacG/DUF329 family)